VRIGDRITGKRETRVIFHYTAPFDYSNDQKGNAWLNQPLPKSGLHKYEHLELSGKYGHLL